MTIDEMHLARKTDKISWNGISQCNISLLLWALLWLCTNYLEVIDFFVTGIFVIGILLKKKDTFDKSIDLTPASVMSPSAFSVSVLRLGGRFPWLPSLQRLIILLYHGLIQQNYGLIGVAKWRLVMETHLLYSIPTLREPASARVILRPPQIMCNFNR